MPKHESTQTNVKSQLTNPRNPQVNPTSSQQRQPDLHRIGDFLAVLCFKGSDERDEWLASVGGLPNNETTEPLQTAEDCEDLESAHPVDFALICDHPTFNDTVDAIFSDYKSILGKRRAALPAYEYCLRAILSNLIEASGAPQETEWRRISLNKNSYPLLARYTGPTKVTHSAVTKACDFLVARNLVDKRSGFHYQVDRSKSRQTRIRLSTEFISSFMLEIKAWQVLISRISGAEPLILKDAQKNLIDYAESKATVRMRKLLRDYGSLLRQTNVSVDGEPLRFSGLRRIFNNSSWEQGGRFYGPWQNFPQEVRQRMQINGDPIVEIDFQGHHLNLLYNAQGIQLQSDPYDLTEYGISQEHRKVIKLCMLRMLNAETATKAGKAIQTKLVDLDIWWHYKPLLPTIIRALKDKHQPIADYFESGIGIRLQFADSKLTEAILDHFMAKRILVLPVHDSYIVAQKHRFELERVMVEVYRDQIDGFAPTVEAKGLPALSCH